MEFADFVPNMERCWGVLSHIFAANVGFALSRMSLTLLYNESNIPFITSDQPAINLKATYNDMEQPEEFELYYPIAPRMAILMTEKPTKLNNHLKNDEVIRLNNTLAKLSKEQIYANQENVLTQYK